MEVTGLTKFDAMHQAIVEVQTIDEAKDIIDKAEALRIYAKQAKLAFEDAQRIAEIKLRAQRRAGEITGGLETAQGARADVTSDQAGPKLTKASQLEDVGIAPTTAKRWEQIASIPEPEFENYLETKKKAEEEITTADALRFSKGTSTAHVSHNSGENEWYTPAKIIEAARTVMGSIDLDPASSIKANEIVKAGRIYTKEDDGLRQEWFGNVWLNPPYAQPLISHFSDKVISEIENIEQICILVNNATETAWFQQLFDKFRAVCFPRGRVKFWEPGGKVSAPLQGQAILYYGMHDTDFTSRFFEFGMSSRISL